ncbi:MAG: cytochrome c biogenesis protein CcmE [Betaproteobacteria bacterium TMED41]|nr:MAG: cytochrome c biogenesis protein CcmE [Betaproteobacteria bacterium TMED41]
MLLNTKRYKRLFWILSLIIVIFLTCFAIIKSFEENLVFFYTTSQILNGDAPSDRQIRLGGMVQNGSIEKKENSLEINFKVIDEKQNIIKVNYTGVVPDLFKEGKGVVAQGKIENGVFKSTEILAKHDENYMPPKLGKLNEDEDYN